MSYYQEDRDHTGNDISHLADDLVHRLGVEDALRACLENSWDGVLLEIQGRINTGVNH